MPWNNPHPAAPSLRAWQDAEGFAYECSAVQLDASKKGRRGMESYLLYMSKTDSTRFPVTTGAHHSLLRFLAFEDVPDLFFQ
jgi:hypothetical protein